MLTASVQSSYCRLAISRAMVRFTSGMNERLTIHPSFAATLTTGLTPQDAIAATASCMAPSRSSMSVALLPNTHLAAKQVQ